MLYCGYQIYDEGGYYRIFKGGERVVTLKKDERGDKVAREWVDQQKKKELL